MADDPISRAELTELRAQLAAQDARLAAQAADLAAFRARLETPRRPRRRFPRRALPLALVALLVILTPLGLLAAAPFNDLTGGVRDANIGLLYDAGITKGCVPNVSYCPTANVTREEMASFLARMAGLGANPPVVNAKTAQTAALATNATNAVNATHATNAINATNAGQLNGQPASFYQPAGQPSANATTAQTLQGYAASGLVRVARGAGFLPGTYLTLTSSYQTIAAVALTAPGPGFVLVQGTASIEGGTYCFTGTRLRDTAAPGTESPPALTETGNAAGTAYAIPVSPTWVFPVATGGRTFVIEAQIAGGSGCYAIDGMLTALFVPFGSGRGSTLAP